MTLDDIRTNANTVIKMIEEHAWEMSDAGKDDWYRSMDLLVQIEQATALTRIAEQVGKLDSTMSNIGDMINVMK